MEMLENNYELKYNVCTQIPHNSSPKTFDTFRIKGSTLLRKISTLSNSLTRPT